MKTPFLIFFSLLCLFTALLGYRLGHFQATQASFPKLLPLSQSNPGVATLKLMEVTGENLRGKVEGADLRIVYSSQDLWELTAGDPFELPLNKIDLQSFYLERQFPENAHFSASTAGKYYYPLLDPRSLRITPKNRLFFATEEEARAAGYLKKD